MDAPARIRSARLKMVVKGVRHDEPLMQAYEVQYRTSYHSVHPLCLLKLMRPASSLLSSLAFIYLYLSSHIVTMPRCHV